jgi:hypothetical protein
MKEEKSMKRDRWMDGERLKERMLDGEKSTERDERMKRG